MAVLNWGIVFPVGNHYLFFCPFSITITGNLVSFFVKTLWEVSIVFCRLFLAVFRVISWMITVYFKNTSDYQLFTKKLMT